MKRLTNKKSQFESVSELLYCKTVYKVQSSIEPYNEEIKIKKGGDGWVVESGRL